MCKSWLRSRGQLVRRTVIVEGSHRSTAREVTTRGEGALRRRRRLELVVDGEVCLLRRRGYCTGFVKSLVDHALQCSTEVVVYHVARVALKCSTVSGMKERSPVACSGRLRHTLDSAMRRSFVGSVLYLLHKQRVRHVIEKTESSYMVPLLCVLLSGLLACVAIDLAQGSPGRYIDNGLHTPERLHILSEIISI
jgi:hypothetical protein